MGYKKAKNILQLSNDKAKEYFLANDSYCNFDLPKYFNFEDLLKKIDNILTTSVKNLTDIYTNTKPEQCNGVNYKIISNKDSCYAWRPLQLINPVLYVDMVNYITQADHWKELCDKFKEFGRFNNIRCVSIPVLSNRIGKKNKAEQILNWWQEVEQQSLQQEINFSYVFITDITDCYGSIYTHSIAWALLGKDNAKQLKGDNEVLGNKLDGYIRAMSYGQTNGIPQGSVLMDFIAEIVLGYADVLLHEKIEHDKDIKSTDYYIIRYRDDYRIFVNNPQIGEKIVKYLTEMLIELGLKLNSAKTYMSSDIIEASLKKDKLFALEYGHIAEPNNQKQLMKLYLFSKRYPNSGVLKRQLTEFFNIAKIDKKKDNIPVLLNIVTEIAYNNSQVYHLTAAITSKLLAKLTPIKCRSGYIDKIIKKFYNLPNTGIMEIWLQRVAYKLKDDYDFSENLCKLVQGQTAIADIWNFDWIGHKKLCTLLKKVDIIDRKILKNIDPEITQEEVDVFKYVYE